jgi:hypothetical protein
MRPDLVSLASGAVVAALGALVLLDSSGAITLSLGWDGVDALVWSLVLAALGAALLGQRSRGEGADRDSQPRPWAAAEPAAAPGEPSRPRTTERSQFSDLYRGMFGVLLVVGAALLFLSSNHILGGIRDAALTGVVVVVAIGLIMAPFLWRLGQNLAEERAERIRTQERAEVGAHLHDSVLQTLVLVQKRADDPREVVALARRQERELRDWLAGGDGRSGDESFASALRSAAEAVEDDHRVTIEVVVVGDCGLDERSEAILGAAREAILNAAKHAPEPGPVRVFAEVGDETIEVFVRDRGPGFDLASVPGDRRGLRESVLGRMERAGGRAEVSSIPDGGTEVALSIGRDGVGEGEAG